MKERRGAAKNGRDRDAEGHATRETRRGNDLKVEAGVEGELGCGLEAGALGLVFLGFDLDGSGGFGGRGRRSEDFGVRVVLAEIGSLEAAILDQIDGLGFVAVG